MRRRLPPLAPLLLMLAIGVAAVSGQRAATLATREAQSPAPATAKQTPPPAVAPAADVAPGALSPRNANYRIEARLDTKQRTITGKQWLTWRNLTAASTSELRYHLYYNAFKNSRSTFLREGRNTNWFDVQDLSGLRADDWGWTSVTKIELAAPDGTAPADLTAGRRYIAPDDGNADDQTVMLVPLPKEVAPGETITVDLEWTAKVPRTFARTGVVGNFYFLAQWFPKVGVLEDDGWNCHQFHASTEFFSDYGVYDVQLTVPKGWVVGATGVEREVRDRTARTDHDDAPLLRRRTSTTSPGRRARTTWSRTARFEQPGLPPVEMRLLLQPEHVGQADRHFEATRAALRYYGEWFGRLPLRPHHDRRPGVAERRRRHGVPDAVHGGLALAGAVRGGRPGGRDRARGRPPVLVRDGRQQRVRGRVDRRGAQHLLDGARTMALAFTPNYEAYRLFGGFVPWVLRDFRTREPWTRTAWRATAAGAKLDAQSTPSWRYWPGDRRRALLQQDGAVAEHARTAPRLVDAAADPVHLLRAVEVQAPEARRTSSPWSTRCPGAT